MVKTMSALLVIMSLATGCAKNLQPNASSKQPLRELAMCAAMLPVDMERDNIGIFKKYYKHPEFLDEYPDKKQLVFKITELGMDLGVKKYGMSVDQAGDYFVGLAKEVTADVTNDMGVIVNLDLPLVEKAKLATSYVEERIHICKPVYAAASKR